jgi:hypothetical protein
MLKEICEKHLLIQHLCKANAVTGLTISNVFLEPLVVSYFALLHCPVILWDGEVQEEAVLQECKFAFHSFRIWS